MEGRKYVGRRLSMRFGSWSRKRRSVAPNGLIIERAGQYSRMSLHEFGILLTGRDPADKAEEGRPANHLSGAKLDSRKRRQKWGHPRIR